MSAKLKPHQQTWLDAHPHRTEQWLRERLRDGFDVHHADGDRNNNSPTNLVLIDCQDHMTLHGSVMCRFIPSQEPDIPVHNRIIEALRRQPGECRTNLYHTCGLQSRIKQAELRSHLEKMIEDGLVEYAPPRPPHHSVRRYRLCNPAEQAIEGI
jgi:hypothetical protein